MYAFATKNTCPFCSFKRSWKIRRDKRKCKRCRREWSDRVVVNGIRATKKEWQSCLETFLHSRSARMVWKETDIGYCRVVKMLELVRRRMNEAMPRRFSGICEADETFIGGQRKNKRLHIRRRTSKRGHGTEKIPITGVFCRNTGQVAAQVLPHRSEETVIGFMVSCLSPDAVLYTDGYKMNRAVRKHGVVHEYVNHHLGEYVRGNIHTNSIEGFWGFMKKHLALIGGIKPPRFQLFVAEIVWRFNHRKLPRRQQSDVLMDLIFPP